LLTLGKIFVYSRILAGRQRDWLINNRVSKFQAGFVIYKTT
jgi:hypothetical protein